MNAAFSDELPLGGVAYQLALIVVVPWLVRAVVSRWNTGAAPVPGSSSSNPSSTKPPFTLPRVSWRHPTSLVLALAACYYLAQIVWAVPASTHNFFDEIGATYDAPNYILRNHFRYYTTARWYEDARGFKEPVPGLRAPSLHTDRLREAMSAVPAGDTRSDVPNSAEDVSRQDWLTALFELLKSAENRRIYLSYGEDAFLRCLWCRDTGDYAIYAPLVLDYALFALVVYLGTSYLTRLFWRRLLLAYTASLLATDASALIMPVLLNNDGATTSGDYADILGLLQPLVDNLQPLPRTVGMLRYTAFTCMLVAVLLYQRTTPTTEQRLARVLAMDEANTLTGKNQQMQDMAVMEDGVLLKHVAAFHTKRQEEAERVRADPMVVKAKSEAQDGTRSNQTARSRSRSHKSSARSADAASDADISG